MDNQKTGNPNRQNQNDGRAKVEFTTHSLGIAASKKKDLQGVILPPNEIAQAVTTMLVHLHVPKDAIYDVKVVSKDGSLEISAIIEEYAVVDTGPVQIDDWLEFNPTVQGGKVKIKPLIFSALRNKAYYQKLHYQKCKIKGDRYITLNFDAEILLAFLYNIPYDDEFYKCSPFAFNINKKTRKKLGYVPSGAILNWRNNDKGFHPNQVEDMN